MAHSPAFRLIVASPQGGRVGELPEHIVSEDMGNAQEMLQLVYQACKDDRVILRCAECDQSTSPRQNNRVLLRWTKNITVARWPRSQHDCPKFGEGNPKAITTTPDQLRAIFEGAATKQGQFYLSIQSENFAVQSKRDPREIADNVYCRQTNYRLKSKLSRRLSGMLIGMIEEAGLNHWPRHPCIANRWGIIKAIAAAVTANANFPSSLGCPIVFPEVQFAGLSKDEGKKICEHICAEARGENSSRRMSGRVVVVGRFVSAHEENKTVNLQVVGLRSCRLEVSSKCWNSSIKSYGQPIPFHGNDGNDGNLESLVIGVVAPSPSGSLEVLHIAWSRIDRCGVPFFESEFESPIAQECYRRGIEFLKPCHLRLALGDRNVWPDYILRTKSGKFLILEVDLTRSATKRKKAILYKEFGLWLCSWNPRAEPDCSRLSIWDAIETEPRFPF